MSPPSDPKRWRIGLIGYGEVGRILAEDLRAAGVAALSACDIKIGGPQQGPLLEHAARLGIRVSASHAEVASNADLIVSAVTASQTVAVAEACAPAIARASWFLDFNSASPRAKIRAAALIDGAGGTYVEGAVMTSIPPYRIRVPLLLGGPGAAALAPALAALGFDASVGPQRLGVASATKLCRSVMIKGMEAMVIESFTAARAYGVERQVIDSLAETFPGIDWEQQATYFFRRVIQHGRRRAEEMREAAETVRDIGLEPLSAAGTAERQAWVAELAGRGTLGAPDAPRTDWREDADRILAQLQRPADPTG